MKSKHFIFILLTFILLTYIAGCNTGTIRDYSLDSYESVDNWELTNTSSKLSTNNYNVSDVGHSLQIINAGCGDMKLKNAFDLAYVTDQESESEAGQDYELSVTVKRSATDYDENAPLDPVDDENAILRGENFSIIIKQGAFTILNQDVIIENDLTWETKTFSFTSKSPGSTYLTFRLGCDLELFWIDNINFRYIEPEPVPEDEET